MKLYVACVKYDDEYELVLGVYSTRDKAAAAGFTSQRPIEDVRIRVCMLDALPDVGEDAAIDAMALPTTWKGFTSV